MELDGGNEFDMEMLYAIRIDGSWKVQRYLWTLGHQLEVKFRLEWSCRVKKKRGKFWTYFSFFLFLTRQWRQGYKVETRIMKFEYLAIK